MLEFVPVSKEMRQIPGVGHKLRLAHSASIGLYLGVYLHSPRQGQVCTMWGIEYHWIDGKGYAVYLRSFL